MQSVITGVFLPVMRSRAYSMREKINLWRGKLSPGTMAMWNEILATDLPTLVPKLEIPAYFMSGVFDYTVSGVLAKVYLDDLEAPLKGFYWFDNSAHSPMFEEPERFSRLLRDLRLTGDQSTVVESR
jgi:pimeloyl-ACP methyl ester carboxylesterase